MQHYVDHFDTVPVIVLVGLERYRAAEPGRGRVGLPGVPEPAARRPRPRLRRRADRLAPRRRARAARGARRSPTASPCRRASRSACRPGTTARCAASRSPTLVHDGRWGRPADVARRPWRWLTTRTPSSASRRGASEDELRAARRRLAKDAPPRPRRRHGAATRDAPAQRWRSTPPWPARPGAPAAGGAVADPAPAPPDVAAAGAAARAGGSPTTSPRSRSRRCRSRRSRRC